MKSMLAAATPWFSSPTVAVARPEATESGCPISAMKTKPFPQLKAGPEPVPVADPDQAQPDRGAAEHEDRERDGTDHGVSPAKRIDARRGGT